MTSGAHVLILSQDQGFFARADEPHGGVSERHDDYLKELRSVAGKNSSLRVICYTGRAPRYADRIQESGMRLFATRSRHRILAGAGFALAMFRCLRDWRPDVISSQNPWGDGTIGYLTARIIGVRFVAQLHFDLFSPAFRAEIRFAFWRLRVARFLLRRADHIRVVSNAVKESLVSKLDIPAERVSVIPVPVAFEEDTAQSPAGRTKPDVDPNAAGPVVLFVGRFVAAKNLGLWVRTADIIHKTVPRVRFVLCGDGPEMDRIEEEVRERELAPFFQFAGAVPYRSLPDFYRSAAVFLLTSNNEGFARVLVEAMHFGVPVVSTRCAGPRDIVLQGRNGFLCDIDDANCLAEMSIRILRDSVLHKKLSEFGREDAEARYSAGVLCRKIAKMWVKASGVNGNSVTPAAAADGRRGQQND